MATRQVDIPAGVQEPSGHGDTDLSGASKHERARHVSEANRIANHAPRDARPQSSSDPSPTCPSVRECLLKKPTAWRGIDEPAGRLSRRAGSHHDSKWGARSAVGRPWRTEDLKAVSSTDLDKPGDIRGCLERRRQNAFWRRLADLPQKALELEGLEANERLSAVRAGDNGKPDGLAINIGARVAASAAPRELLVSSTVKDLTAGSG